MKISKDRFEELITLYLDGEAMPEDLRLMANCVLKDKEMARAFKHACLLHKATCAYYGKKCEFTDLTPYLKAAQTPKSSGRMKAIVGWSRVAALLAMCFGTFSFYSAVASDSSAKTAPNISKASEEPLAEDYDVSVPTGGYYTEGDFCLLKISPKCCKSPK